MGIMGLVGLTLKRGIDLNLTGLGVSLAILLSVPSVALAQNQGTPEEQQACQPDVMRLCGNFIPDVDRIVGCLKTSEPQLSPPCHDVMFPKSNDPPKKKRKTRS
jgi:hypothetical protein